MSKPKVLLNLAFPDFMHELFVPHCEFQPWSLLQTGDTDALADIAALVIYGHPKIDGTLLDRLPNLKVISNFGVGVDHINIADATGRGIPVGNTPGAVDRATADMTMALLLAVSRNIVTGNNFARQPDWTFFNPGDLPGKEVFGSTLGIIGLGGIGKQVARRARGFDMRILYHNRNRNLAAERELGVEYAEKQDLLASADYVTLNIPLTPQTHHLIGEAELKQMKSDAMLINIARGGVLDHNALYRALTEGWIAAAAVDVTEPEPLPRDHPLLDLENIIITPHLGSATVQTRKKMGQMMVENMLAGLQGRVLPYPVNQLD